MSSQNYAAVKAGEWQQALLRCVAALILFETLTGLAILLLPFSVPNQMMVLLHTVAGIASVVPYAWYQLRHWKIYRAIRLSHVKLTGYFAMVASIALIVSGLILTAQALFAVRISRALDLIHIAATFALIASVLPHIVTLLVRALRKSAAFTPVRAAALQFGLLTIALSASLFVPVALATVFYRPPRLVNELPADYSYQFGPDRPFAPSLARTASGGAYDARSLAGSKSCGTSNCHSEIYDEWAVSAHRYSAMDPAFQKVQTVMGEQNGPESTRYCGGCHDPISLFSGTKNLFSEDLTNRVGYQEGVSCVACHAIKETDVKGNAAYVMSQPRRYIFEFEAESSSVARAVRDFLIRSYPRYHIETLQHKLFKSPEFCAACHKQFIDEEINRVGWVQLQNQFDNWRKSRWNHPGDPTKTIECRECHMPLTASSDPGRGDDRDYNRLPGDGKHRSHRFLGANQFIPSALKLPGAEDHVRLTEKWLRGEIAIPEIADKWREGPAVPVELIAPATAIAGRPLTLQAVLTNNKPGHDFPTGPLDIIQSWVELSVTDQAGNIVFHTGQRDSSHFIAAGSFMLKAEPVDQYGNLIDRHNLWEMVGVRYRRALYPGFSDRERFTFVCPGTIVESQQPPRRSVSDSSSPLDRTVGFRVPKRRVTELHVTARLMYRKADQFLLNFLFGRESGITAPVTVMSEDRATIRVVSGE